MASHPASPGDPVSGRGLTRVRYFNQHGLKRRIPDAKTLAAEVEAWQDARNRDRVTIAWCFEVADAREKMHRVYPKRTPAADQ